MAKPTKNATPICIGLSLLALAGIILGIVFESPLIVAFALLPTVGYEIYRTEGRSTKTSSALLMVVLVAEIILIIFNIGFDLAEFFGVTEKYVAGYNVPLGDIKVVGPVVMAVLSVVLFVRTYGVYTRWLAVIIFITSFALVYVLDPGLFPELLRFGVDEGLRRVAT